MKTVRFLTVAAAILCLFSVLFSCAAPSGDFEYVLRADGSYGIKASKTGLRGDVEIPSEYENGPVTAISDLGFSYTGIESVILPEGVTDVGDFAFYRCEKLKTVTLPESVKKINMWAFSGCSKLEKILFTGTPEQWEAIEKGTGWDGKTGNYSVVFPGEETAGLQ